MTDKEAISQALYPLSEAARLAGTTASALGRWSSPYRVKRYYLDDKREHPLIVPTSPANGTKLFSFVNLIEAHFIVLYRQSGVSLRSVQSAVEYARREFQDDHPLQTYRFVTDGKVLFHRLQEEQGLTGLVAVSSSGQFAWPSVVDEFLQAVDYDEAERPFRWWPKGKDNTVVIDPRFAFGYPVVIGKHIRTDTLAERFEADESVDEIALDFGVEKTAVEDAVRFELMLKKAA